MPAHPTSDLHQLVHSLSKNEKRYVKRYCTQHILHDGNVYVDLFDAVIAQDEYDEKALGMHPTLTSYMRRIPALKNYLYNKILDAMRMYHSNSTIEKSIPELFADADFLWEKALYDMAWKRIQKAKKLCINNHEYPYWLKAIAWEKNYHYLIQDTIHLTKDISTLSDEYSYVIRLAETSKEFEDTATRLQHLLYAPSEARTKEDAIWLRLLPKLTLLSSDAAATTIPTRINRHMILAAWHLVYNRTPDESIQHAQAVVEILKRETDFANANTDAMLTAETHLLSAYSYAGKKRQYSTLSKSLWKRYDSLPNGNHRIKLLYRLLRTECRHEINGGVASELHARFDVVLRTLYSSWHKIPDSYALDVGVALARLCKDLSRNTDNRKLRRLCSLRPPRVRPDLHASLHLQLLTDAVDKQDWSWCANHIRSLQRHLREYLIASSSLNIMLQAFRKLCDDPLHPIAKASREVWVAIHHIPGDSGIHILTNAGTLSWLHRRAAIETPIQLPPTPPAIETGIYF